MTQSAAKLSASATACKSETLSVMGLSRWCLSLLLTAGAVVAPTAVLATNGAPDVVPWMLSSKDLPGDWYSVPPSPSAPGCFSCTKAIAELDPGSVARAQFDLVGGGAATAEHLASWASSEKAAHAWQVINAQVSTCRQYTISADEETMVVSVKTINLGQFASFSHVFQVSGSYRGSPQVGDYLLAEKGRAVVVVSYAVFGNGVEASRVRLIFNLALAKVKG